MSGVGGGVWAPVFWWWGVVICCLTVVWLRGFGVVVSFRPVSASSLRLLLGV